MTDKTGIIVIAQDCEVSGSGSGMERLLKRSAIIENFKNGDPLEGADKEVLVESKASDVAELVEKGGKLAVIDLSGSSASDFEASINQILEDSNRRTVIAVVAKNGLFLYGSGIDGKAGKVDRAAEAKDIIPTIAYIADLPIEQSCTGAILYQALRRHNLKLHEMGKLKEAIIRMEAAMARDNREPWDKHDCA